MDLQFFFYRGVKDQSLMIEQVKLKKETFRKSVVIHHHHFYSSHIFVEEKKSFLAKGKETCDTA